MIYLLFGYVLMLAIFYGLLMFIWAVVHLAAALVVLIWELACFAAELIGNAFEWRWR
jgi:hypothetical protein